MSLLKYENYILESTIYDLILESEILYSNKFIKVLTSMSSNKIAKSLLDLYKKDIDIQHNYIDLTDQKDTVSFTPDRKAKEILTDKDKLVTYEVINSEKYLTHGAANNRIFDLLEYTKPDGDPWAPQEGTIGVILREVVSPTSGKTFVIFKELDGDRKTVINKLDGLEISDNVDDSKLWSTSRNNIKVGRLARAILTASKVSFNDKDIEEFSNSFKATFDVINDILKQFDVVKGSDIAYWYDNDDTDRYKRGDGSLNNSCMSEAPSHYFDIYTKNTQVSLVILYDDNGSITDGKYKSRKIKGRAILWEAKVNDQKITFMDRIYTVNESDVDLFKQYAQKNGWWYKVRQSYDLDYKDITNGKETLSDEIISQLDAVDFESYPYVDTLCFINLENKTASNRRNGGMMPNVKALRNTDGEYTDPRNY